MEFLTLSYFVQVTELGSFSRAAASLGLTQPALSRQVRKLESELRTELFYRHGRGIALTPSGRKLYAAVKPLLEALADIREAIQEDSERMTGTVTIGLPPSLCATLGAPLDERFRWRYPDAVLRTREGFSGILMEWIEAGRLDLAILYDARRGRSMHVAPLLEEYLYLIQPPAPNGDSSPLAIDALDQFEFVLPGPENGLRRVVDAAVRQAGVVLQIKAEMDSVAALKQLVLNGHGATILPFGAVHQEVEAGRLVARRISSPAMQAKLITATPLNQPVSRVTRAVLSLVHECVEELVRAGKIDGTMHGMSSD
ncbi:LysR substrate-binding domain-containing protein [Aurantimonas endophytica]|uniref:LysR family nitrogen assimilation transcriptional regulator n=1 Tax=Aurantimonas endophytica TaxID=1522175 RepID=A0A7W6MPX7_9HYPH|nr:LysR substrate-binding domain-containing protein [Aurantimonas endophytica]MBB4003410.1 LysR family nitrogen assimilation transcriptional regulator [Aurantimonas endophytica]MCO6404271.1 LysR family transcriptional regulator [Aurantimonas endophytica]